MKKYFIVLGTCLTIGICLSVNLQWDGSEQDKFGVTMENIEALASGENPEVFCNMPGSLDCPKSTIKVKYIL